MLKAVKMRKTSRQGHRLTQLFSDPEVKTSSLMPSGKKNPRKSLSLKEFERRKKKRKSK